MARARRFPTALLAPAILAGVILGGSSARGQGEPEPAPAPAPKAAAKAQAPAPASNSKASVGRSSIFRLVTNPMMIPLAACSVVAVGFALERMVALRRNRVIPKDFVNRFVDRLSNGKLDRDRAAELCRANESPTARIFAQVVGYWGQPAAEIRQAIGHDAAGEVADLKRNVRVLNATATLAPLLGLLGTVIGMIESFGALGERSAGTAKGEALAHGISLALGATAAGLLVAVVSVVAYYYLLNRVDLVVRDLDAEVRRVIDLVAAEAPRPSAPLDSRRGANDFGRHEPRAATLGRADPL